jgi:acetyl esterase/lipase
MPIGPQTRAFFDRTKIQAKENPSPPVDKIPLATLRQTTLDAFREYAGRLPEGVSFSSFQDDDFELPSKYIVHAKTYTPKEYNPASSDTVIFFQGNGFVFDMLESHLPGFARMANAANCKVIGIATPLAPEHSAQKINDIAYETVRYVFQNAAKLGVTPDNIILAGYSAGGNLVANIVSRARTDEIIRIKHQLLLSPCLDLSLETHQNSPYAEFQKLDESTTRETLKFIVGLYHQDVDPKTPLISPLFKKNLTGVPSTTIVLAEFDALRGDGHAYADKLKAAGVPVKVIICEQQTHNYFIARGVMNDGIDPAIVMANVITGKNNLQDKTISSGNDTH